jgi:hypothetical protein
MRDEVDELEADGVCLYDEAEAKAEFARRFAAVNLLEKPLILKASSYA